MRLLWHCIPASTGMGTATELKDKRAALRPQILFTRNTSRMCDVKKNVLMHKNVATSINMQSLQLFFTAFLLPPTVLVKCRLLDASRRALQTVMEKIHQTVPLSYATCCESAKRRESQMTRPRLSYLSDWGPAQKIHTKAGLLRGQGRLKVSGSSITCRPPPASFPYDIETDSKPESFQWLFPSTSWLRKEKSKYA